MPYTPLTYDVSPAHKRVLWLDVVRVVVIWGIIAQHVCGRYLHERWAILPTIAFSACLFFMTSGALVLPIDRNNTARWLRRHVVRILLPTLFWCIALLPLLDFEYGFDAFKWREVIMSIPVRATFDEGWFCWTLIGLYLFVPILSPWIRVATRRALLYFIALWLVGGLLPYVHWFTEFYSPRFTFLGPFVGFIGYMVAGYYLRRYPIGRERRWIQCIFWAVILVTCTYITWRLYHFAFRYHLQDTLRDDLTLHVMCWSIALYALASYIKAMPRWLSAVTIWMSKRVFAIFFAHIPITLALPYILTEWSIWYIPGTIALATLLAGLIHLLPYSIRRFIA